ncbi:MAG: type ISP restriction/modification enzyme [Microcoleus sp.]
MKAIRWASDRIGDEGIVALVTNNSFVNDIAFDGMRKHLQKDFDALYILDLGGNVRKNPQLSGTTHNVFGIQVGVSINLFVRNKNGQNSKPAQIYYARVDELWRKEEKYEYLEKYQHRGGVEWQLIQPDLKYNWLTEGLQDDFEKLIPIGGKEAKASNKIDERVIFKLYSNGVKTNRDTWVYNFNEDAIAENVKRTIATYNEQMVRWSQRCDRSVNIDDFVTDDDTKVSWSGTLKTFLSRGVKIEYNPDLRRRSTLPTIYCLFSLL